MSTEKLAAAAIRWARLEAEKELAYARFREAWAKCFVTRFPEDVPLFFKYEGRWLYDEASPNFGQDASADPLCIAQVEAWREYKAAVRAAGGAKGALRRMANREAGQ